jgi:phosphatidylglycerol:prolipoprotein diacylglycerol transferase
LFPLYVHLGHRTFHPHFFFEALSYIVAAVVYLALRRRFPDPIIAPLRWAVVAAAVAGAAIGSKLLFWFEDPRLTLQNLHNPAYLAGGKTIVGALVFGLISVELSKRYIGLRTSTGDLYAIPLALGIAIGRIGCFLTGLPDNTYGTPTNLPWAVNFGDGIPRHPTQLYEIIFLLALIPLLYHVLNRIFPNRTLILRGAGTQRSEVAAQLKDLVFDGAITNVSGRPYDDHGRQVPQQSEPVLTTNDQRPMTLFIPGDAFKLFMVAYMSFRLLADFIKPYPRIFLGLGGIQWACVLILLYYFRDIARWLRSGPIANPRP